MQELIDNVNAIIQIHTHFATCNLWINVPVFNDRVLTGSRMYNPDNPLLVSEYIERLCIQMLTLIRLKMNHSTVRTSELFCVLFNHFTRLCKCIKQIKLNDECFDHGTPPSLTHTLAPNCEPF